jgi:hypothetical protein
MGMRKRLQRSVEWAEVTRVRRGNAEKKTDTVGEEEKSGSLVSLGMTNSRDAVTAKNSKFRRGEGCGRCGDHAGGGSAGSEQRAARTGKGEGELFCVRENGAFGNDIVKCIDMSKGV